MIKMICFDMDGTIADLYGVNGWCEKLNSRDVTPYESAKPLWNTEKLNSVLNTLTANGWIIAVISWMSKTGTPEYNKEVRRAKAEWLTRYAFPSTENHFLKYGETKANAVRKKCDYAILVDDNAKVRSGWTLGETINPQGCDLIEKLAALLNEAEKEG